MPKISIKRPYDSVRWRKASKLFLKQTEHCLCETCLKFNQITTATIVDHKQPWKEGKTKEEQYELFWNQDNWQGICAICHGAKRTAENKGFSQSCDVEGNPIDPGHPWLNGNSKK